MQSLMNQSRNCSKMLVPRNCGRFGHQSHRNRHNRDAGGEGNHGGSDIPRMIKKSDLLSEVCRRGKWGQMG